MRPRLAVLLAVAAAALLPTGALAQSFYPNLAGARFCRLRQMGVSPEAAQTAAIRENWSPYRQEIPVRSPWTNQMTSTDIVEYVQYLLTACPAYMRGFGNGQDI